MGMSLWDVAQASERGEYSHGGLCGKALSCI